MFFVNLVLKRFYYLSVENLSQPIATQDNILGFVKVTHFLRCEVRLKKFGNSWLSCFNALYALAKVAVGDSGVDLGSDFVKASLCVFKKLES